MLLLKEVILTGVHQKTKEEEEVEKEVAKLLVLFKKVIKAPTVKALGWQAVKHLPSLYNAATSRIKNDKIRRALQSDTAKNVLNSTTNMLLWMAGTWNITIKKYFENENDDL